MHPLQGVSLLSTPLQGGILKPPALRVVVDFLDARRKCSIAPDFVVTPSYFLCLRHGFWALGSRCAIIGHFLHALPFR